MALHHCLNVLEVLRQPLEEGSPEYNLPHVLDLAALAALAERFHKAILWTDAH